MKQVGLHNICTIRVSPDSKPVWRYLLFYDFDKRVVDFSYLLYWVKHLAYVLYQTRKGYHYVGLTPLTVLEWAVLFDKIQKYYNGYYSGHTIRLSRKLNEKQVLISWANRSPALYPLCTIYEKRFNIKFSNVVDGAGVFEEYDTGM
jgi:hypothetical protein